MYYTDIQPLKEALKQMDAASRKLYLWTLFFNLPILIIAVLLLVSIATKILVNDMYAHIYLEPLHWLHFGEPLALMGMYLLVFSLGCLFSPPIFIDISDKKKPLPVSLKYVPQSTGIQVMGKKLIPSALMLLVIGSCLSFFS